MFLKKGKNTKNQTIKYSGYSIIVCEKNILSKCSFCKIKISKTELIEFSSIAEAKQWVNKETRNQKLKLVEKSAKLLKLENPKESKYTILRNSIIDLLNDTDFSYTEILGVLSLVDFDVKFCARQEFEAENSLEK